MRVAELFKDSKKPLISFEFFPPRNEKSAKTFEKVLNNLAELNPDFVSVTFGAGGSTREGSYQLVNKIKKDGKLKVVAYLAGYGLGPDEITSILDAYKKIGIETIFVIRGDKPREDSGFKAHPESLSYASDMLDFIKKRYDFCLGAAAYPEGHIEAESLEKDIEYLKLKVDNGAEYVVCQYFYNNNYYYDFVERCKAIGINVPILPGIMPVYTVKMTENLAKLCGSKITKELKDGLSKLPADDKEAVINFGIDFAAKQCEDLLKKGVPGLHFYTMDRSKTVVEIVNRLKNKGLL
ncbi:5,10-methylenetetrahydrofolate reductase [Candidatus Magnetomoraceae bacterium gMMP-15]